MLDNQERLITGNNNQDTFLTFLIYTIYTKLCCMLTLTQCGHETSFNVILISDGAN